MTIEPQGKRRTQRFQNLQVVETRKLSALSPVSYLSYVVIRGSPERLLWQRLWVFLTNTFWTITDRSVDGFRTRQPLERYVPRGSHRPRA
jgi:hypothetical protein